MLKWAATRINLTKLTAKITDLSKKINRQIFAKIVHISGFLMSNVVTFVVDLSHVLSIVTFVRIVTFVATTYVGCFVLNRRFADN